MGETSLGHVNDLIQQTHILMLCLILYFVLSLFSQETSPDLILGQTYPENITLFLVKMLFNIILPPPPMPCKWSHHVTFFAFLNPPMRATCPGHLIPSNMIAIIVSDDVLSPKGKSFRTTKCTTLKPNVTEKHLPFLLSSWHIYARSKIDNENSITHPFITYFLLRAATSKFRNHDYSKTKERRFYTTGPYCHVARLYHFPIRRRKLPGAR
jgi:hypothetical protein